MKIPRPPARWFRRMAKELGPGIVNPAAVVGNIWYHSLDAGKRREIINKAGGLTMATRRRHRAASPAQLRALARGRAAMARKRRGSTGGSPRRRRRARVQYLSGGTRRRRSLVGIARMGKGLTSPLMDALLGSGGAVVAGILANLIPVGDKRVKALIPLGAGVITAAAMKDRRIKMIGVGMAIAGTISTIKQWIPNIPILAGDDTLVELPDYFQRPGAAMGDIRKLAGVSRLAGPVHLIPGAGERFRTSADM